MRIMFAALYCVVFSATTIAQDRSRPVHNPAADAKSCTSLVENPLKKGGGFEFRNNCPTAVEFFWCTVQECQRGSGNTWTIGSGKTWPVGPGEIRWGACRGANSGGFDRGTNGTRYTCPNLKW